MKFSFIYSEVVILFNSRICIVLFHNICFLLESVCFHFFILSMFFKYDFLYFFDVFRIATLRSFCVLYPPTVFRDSFF